MIRQPHRKRLYWPGGARRSCFGIAVAIIMLMTGCAGGNPTEEAPVETVMVGDIEVRLDGLSARDEAYRADEITFELEAGEGIEYKYRLEEGDTMVYAWETSGPVHTEMHAEADGQAEGTAEYFEVIESSDAAHGTFVAPFPGIHGWYWLNLNDDEPITLTLRSSGFYSYAMEFSGGSRRRYEPDLVTEPADAE